MSGLLDDTVEIVRSNKGGAKIIHRGYMYTVHKKKVGGIRWRCARRILHCKGSITTGVSGPPVINLPHNHVPDLHAVAMARCRSFSDTDLPENILDCPMPLSIQHSLMSDYSDPPDMREVYEEKFRMSNSTSPSPSLSSMKSILKPSKTTTPAGNKKQNTPKRNTPGSSAPDAEAAEVCLRWNSHHSNMQVTFPTLLDKEMYVDVTLAAEGKTVKCHRLILSSCSDFFDDMLKTVPPFHHPIIFLHNIAFWQMKALIDFMYKGEVNVDQTKLESLLKAAEILQVKGLAGKSNIKQEEPDEKIPETPLPEEDSVDDYLQPTSPQYVANPTDEDEFKPYYYYKKKMSKKKKKIVPAPGQLKTVPCNLRGTKSRPNIKQPVFYDPDFPDHDPNRSVSPPTPEKDSTFHIVNVKVEPIDFDMPESPPYYEPSTQLHLDESEISDKNDVDEPPAKKPAIMIIKKPSTVVDDDDDEETEDNSPVIIKKLSNNTSSETLVVEKVDKRVDDKKYCVRVVKTSELNGGGEERKYLSVKKIASESATIEKNSRIESVMSDVVIKLENKDETESDTHDTKSDESSTSKMDGTIVKTDKSKIKTENNGAPKNRLTRSELGFKKIKLTTTESVLQKLAKRREQDDDVPTDKKEDDNSGSITNCDNEQKSSD